MKTPKLSFVFGVVCCLWIIHKRQREGGKSHFESWEIYENVFHAKVKSEQNLECTTVQFPRWGFLWSNRYFLHQQTWNQFQMRKRILQFMPRDCLVLRGLSRLSRRLDVSCTISSFGNVTRFESLSMFHTTSTIESMLDDRGSFSWCLEKWRG